LIPIIASALGAAGGVAGGVASALSASNNARAAATAQAELERHNREVEAQLKAGSGVISDYVGKTPMIGNLLKPLLQKLGLGIGDYNRIIKGGCVRCGKGLYLKPYGSGLYIGPKIWLFDDFMKEFKRIEPLSNFQIIEKCKQLNIKNFKGVFMRD